MIKEHCCDNHEEINSTCVGKRIYTNGTFKCINQNNIYNEMAKKTERPNDQKTNNRIQNATQKTRD